MFVGNQASLSCVYVVSLVFFGSLVLVLIPIEPGDLVEFLNV